MSIKAVVWDFGGVLTSSPFEAFNRYESENDIPKDFIRQMNATNPDTNAWARFEQSELSLAEFDLAFAQESRKAGHKISGIQVINLLAGDIREEMVHALKTCSRHFKVGCITNNVRAGEGPGMSRGHKKALAVQEVMALFEVVIESSKVGVRKPNPEIYLMACDALGVAPEETVYLDDLGVNLKPARALGMTTIKVIEPNSALEELETATALKFS